jgi:uncharacterized protein with NAD-binding domain and iron-sulfur cluster
MCSKVLKTREEFVNTANLGAVDILAVRLWLDRKVHIPMPSNACFGFDSTTGWTFFDLNSLHDEYRDEPGTVVEADFVRLNYLVLKFIVGSNTNMHDAGHKSLPMIVKLSVL